MCGIAGVLHMDGQPIERLTLLRMADALSHRGPEGRGVHLASRGPMQVGLAHTRLKIVDLSDDANQPMSNEDGSVWVVFNGEIYNFLELRAWLQGRGVQFRTSSDTEVLLRLYEVQGEACVNALDGMFAVAVWDQRQGQLFLARDRVGKKPLFYCHTPTRFAFASEIKALFQHPEIVPHVNEAMLPAFFLYGYVPTPHTIYRGVQKVPPGHVLRIGRDAQLHLKEYWDVPLASASLPIASDGREATTRVRELVTAAVRRRLIADVPLGAFLSGGIDSSIVVGLMSQLLREPVRTFSIGFARDREFDETSFARIASQRFNTKHTEFMVDPSAVELVEDLVWHHDGPFADSSAIPTYLLSQLTREHVTVALNGDGGDELFAGYLRFYATLLAERVPPFLRRSAQHILAGLPTWGGHRGILSRLQKFSSASALPFHERYTRWISVFYDDLSTLLPDQQHSGHPLSPLVLLEPAIRRCRDVSALTKLLYVNMKTYLLDDLLVKMDRCSMAHALETRSPFLDRELIEYVFQLPDHLKLRGGRTKAVLRDAFADLLPQEILHRGKMGFGVPLERWFKADLRSYLQEMLLGPDARLRHYVNAAYVRQLVQAHLSGHVDYSSRLWTLLTFEVWLRQLSTWPQRTSLNRRLMDNPVMEQV